jgi:shikimate dehydrogenase
LLRPHHAKALILGTGGASKAVRYVLDHLGIAAQFVSRTKKPGQFSYDEINEDVLSQFQLIINTTPAGMYPNVDEAPELPYDLLTSSHFLFDLTYNPPKTKFLEEGERRGTQISNGYQMLIEQAEEAWRIWNE